jgi:hypothetical protein
MSILPSRTGASEVQRTTGNTDGTCGPRSGTFFAAIDDGDAASPRRCVPATLTLTGHIRIG